MPIRPNSSLFLNFENASILNEMSTLGQALGLIEKKENFVFRIKQEFTTCQK